MKKIVALLLALSLVLSFAACGQKDPVDEPVSNNDPIIEEPQKTPEEAPKEEPEKAPEKAPEAEKPATLPEEKPVEKPTEKPAEKPVDKPAEPAAPLLPQEPAPAATVGQTLLAKFKSVASGKSAEAIAAELIAGDALPFMAGTAPMSEGFLSGFDEEIKGFSEAAMFGPMIGTIPFIGYVFTLPADADVNAFISTLKANANLRWNICVSAEEMVTGNVGQTVFFVMCPAQFEE